MTAVCGLRIQSQRTAIKVLSRNFMKPVCQQRIQSQRTAVKVINRNVMKPVSNKEYSLRGELLKFLAGMLLSHSEDSCYSSYWECYEGSLGTKNTSSGQEGPGKRALDTEHHNVLYKLYAETSELD